MHAHYSYNFEINFLIIFLRPDGSKRAELERSEATIIMRGY